MSEAQPVKIVDQEKPVKVELEEAKAETKLVTKESKKSLAPTTTEQEDITTAGQRRINLIWELTQGIIAIIITVSIIFSAFKSVQNKTLEDAFIMIITMYFVRTNHSLIGGVGKKPLNQQR